MKLFKSKDVVGVDIGTSSVKLVELKESSKGFQLQSFAIGPIPPQAIVDGQVRVRWGVVAPPGNDPNPTNNEILLVHVLAAPPIPALGPAGLAGLVLGLLFAAAILLRPHP